jgi:hypothetical protein
MDDAEAGDDNALGGGQRRFHAAKRGWGAVNKKASCQRSRRAAREDAGIAVAEVYLAAALALM